MKPSVALHQSIEEEHQKESLSAFLSKRFSVPIFLAILIAFFNQLSGINAIIYFAPRVFELAGIGKQAAFLQSAGIGLVNLVFTMLGLYLIDRLGRRKLMLIGSVGYILSLGAVAAAFYFNYLGGMVVPLLLFVFIASHAIGQGAVIWVFISEIFPNSVRAYGQSLGLHDALDTGSSDNNSVSDYGYAFWAGPDIPVFCHNDGAAIVVGNI